MGLKTNNRNYPEHNLLVRASFVHNSIIIGQPTTEMTAIKELVLYSYYQSSASWRVRTVLAFKKIKYTYEAVNLLGSEQHSEKYVSVNPMHQAPSMKVIYDTGETHILTQSLTIIQFLEETYPEISIFPKDPILRAKSRAIAETISSGIQPLQNLETLVEYTKPINQSESSRDDRKKIAQFWMTRKFDKLEKLVKSTSGKYCVGDEVSLADICLVPQMHNAKRFDIDTSIYPTLTAINLRMLELDIIKESHPLSCPDAPRAD